MWIVALMLLIGFTGCDHRPDIDSPDQTDATTDNNNGTTTDDNNPPTDDKISIDDFVGVFTLNANESYSKKKVSWSVRIYQTTAKRTNNKEWVKIEGLYEGNDFMSAYGYFDSHYECIRIPANILDTEDSWIFTAEPDTAYYSAFIPCYTANNGKTFYSLDADTDEMWLKVNANGLLLDASEYPSAARGFYANCFTFYYYYKDYSGTPPKNWLVLYENVTFAPSSSYMPQRIKQRKKLSILSKQL